MNLLSVLMLIFLTTFMFNVGIGSASQITLTWNNNTAVSYSYLDMIYEDAVYNFSTECVNICNSGNLVYSVYTSMPPIIDGSLSLDEWGEPAIIDTLSYTNDSVNYETHDMFVHFMNDNNYLYIAVKITNDDFESESYWNGDLDSLEIWFDGNNNGIIEPGEDIKKFTNLIYDDWYYVENYTWCSDATLDGEGVASHSNQAIGDYTYEFKIPLNSGDAHDIAVTSDSTIGLHIIYSELYYDSIDDCWICDGNSDAWPNNNDQLNGLNYGKLMLNSSSTKSLSIGSANAPANSTVTIPVSVANVTNISGISLDLFYNSSVVTVSSVTVNESFVGSSITPNIDNANGITNIVLTNSNLISASAETPVIDIALNITGESGSSTFLDLQNVKFSDANSIPYTPAIVVDGQITVGIKGDFNGNGRVDIGDVAKVAFMVAGKVPEDLNADFNGNGRVDIGDAAKIAFYLAGKVSEL